MWVTWHYLAYTIINIIESTHWVHVFLFSNTIGYLSFQSIYIKQLMFLSSALTACKITRAYHGMWWSDLKFDYSIVIQK